MKKSKWLDCQENEFFPKQKGTPSLVKIEHKNTATLDSARLKKKSKSQFCNYECMVMVWWCFGVVWSVSMDRTTVMLTDQICKRVCLTLKAQGGGGVL